MPDYAKEIVNRRNRAQESQLSIGATQPAALRVARSARYGRIMLHGHSINILSKRIARAILRFVLCAMSLGLVSQQSVRAADKPNIIFLLTDDMGYGDVGCYGGK